MDGVTVDPDRPRRSAAVRALPGAELATVRDSAAPLDAAGQPTAAGPAACVFAGRVLGGETIEVRTDTGDRVL